MIEILKIIILAIVQGATEWLPISSSGHLVLFTDILKFDGGLAFDVALHFGTLLAVIVYFWKDLIEILKSLIKWDVNNENFRLIGLLIIASLPATIIGFLFYDFFNNLFTGRQFLGIGFLITAIGLYIGTFNFSFKKEKISYFDSLIMGIGQAIAIIPSISRSGTTIVAGFIRGIDEKKAARFSFLMSIPVILGANLLVGAKDLAKLSINLNLIIGIAVSFVVGILIIHWLMKSVFKDKKNLIWFALYCLILGLLIIFGIV